MRQFGRVEIPQETFIAALKMEEKGCFTCSIYVLLSLIRESRSWQEGEGTMSEDELILAILRTLPSHSVKGKKRLQKLVFLLQKSGVECSARFAIRNFGPFSPAIETSSAFLVLLGDIEEREVATGYA